MKCLIVSSQISPTHVVVPQSLALFTHLLHLFSCFLSLFKGAAALLWLTRTGGPLVVFKHLNHPTPCVQTPPVSESWRRQLRISTRMPTHTQLSHSFICHANPLSYGSVVGNSQRSDSKYCINGGNAHAKRWVLWGLSAISNRFCHRRRNRTCEFVGFPGVMGRFSAQRLTQAVLIPVIPAARCTDSYEMKKH